MSYPDPLDRHGILLKSGDNIRFVGDPVRDYVYYTTEMENMLNDGVVYKLEMVTPHISDSGKKMNIIRAAGWNWDIKNIVKVGMEVKNPSPVKSKSVTFDEGLIEL